MTFGSLFCGVGGFDIGFERSGFECRWQCEREPFAMGVLRRHWPKVPKFDDIRSFATGRKFKHLKVDVICGGFPCQDLSVAGKREGIGGERSGLFYDMVRVVDRLRPRFLVWENVPGLLSSFTPVNPPPEGAAEGSEWEVDEDSDFEAVLCALADIGFAGAWRILDARYFGVPQRRRRVFGVFADHRAGADFRDCCQILALTDGLRGHLEAGGKKGKDLAATLRSRSHGRGVNTPGRGGEDDSNVVRTLTSTNASGQQCTPDNADILVAGTIGGGSGIRGWCDDTDRATFVANTMTASDGGPKIEDTLIPALARCVTTGEGERQDPTSCTLVIRTNQGNSNGNLVTEGVAPTIGTDAACLAIASTIAASQGHHGHSSPRGDGGDNLLVAYQCQGGNVGEMGTIRSGNGNATGGVPFLAAFAQNQRDEVRDLGDAAGAISAEPGTKQRTLVANFQSSQSGVRVNDEMGTLDSNYGGRRHNGVMVGSGVRRLTPRECERCQGFPDDHTRWDETGEEITDGHRYRMIGNAVVPAVAFWIARRLKRFGGFK